MLMSERLKNKVGLITGAAQGLGKEMAKAMIAQGAKIIITDINEDVLKETSEELSCKYLMLDVTKESDWKDVIGKIKEDEASLNILVNNAGIGGGGDVENTELESVVQKLTLLKSVTVNTSSFNMNEIV